VRRIRALVRSPTRIAEPRQQVLGQCLLSQTLAAEGSSTNDSRTVRTKWKLPSSGCSTIPDLDREVFLASLLQQTGKQVVESFSRVDAGVGGDVHDSLVAQFLSLLLGHLVPVAFLPVSGASLLGRWAQTRMQSLVTSLIVPLACSREVVRVEGVGGMLQRGVLLGSFRFRSRVGRTG